MIPPGPPLKNKKRIKPISININISSVTRYVTLRLLRVTMLLNEKLNGAGEGAIQIRPLALLVLSSNSSAGFRDANILLRAFNIAKSLYNQGFYLLSVTHLRRARIRIPFHLSLNNPFNTPDYTGEFVFIRRLR